MSQVGILRQAGVLHLVKSNKCVSLWLYGCVPSALSHRIVPLIKKPRGVAAGLRDPLTRGALTGAEAARTAAGGTGTTEGRVLPPKAVPFVWESTGAPRNPHRDRPLNTSLARWGQVATSGQLRGKVNPGSPQLWGGAYPPLLQNTAGVS